MNPTQLKQTSTLNKNFDFVNTIRCISMMGILFEHSQIAHAPMYSTIGATIVETGVLQFFKFSTIAFFLIGGFLINHKFQEYSAIQYLKNRFKNTVKPWLFWILVYLLLTMLDRTVAYMKGSDGGLMFTDFWAYISDLGYRVLFFSPYWFILNFLICITLLLIFKKYLYNYWLGILFGIISLSYSVNLYYKWFETTHTSALFGFVFYLWLGVFLNKYYIKVVEFIKKSSWLMWVLLYVATFSLGVWESMHLIKLGSTDAYNTLRISNIIYSLVSFGILLKIGSIKTLDKLKPRETTFGIYLIHSIVIERFLPLIFQPLKLNVAKFNVWQNTGLLLGRFVIVYILCYLLSSLIVKTKMKWTVGQ
ncbi:acyltransferase family protein [Pedobacter rhizosphaerae]|uniref:Fucose 4-O-acetylase n=1 Tax=Pedobacter rhizosphaerae TaxID=390241 RepID=A0A1H9V3I6_9SPHI|nr:acyltransferase [Pedobacter rhizosphaerae]SES16380.1 Fucose 4-O-acetylase [Pedobacter rhizosphaerae]